MTIGVHDHAKFNNKCTHLQSHHVVYFKTAEKNKRLLKQKKNKMNGNKLFPT
jgi:hypothetical protein